MRQQNGTGNDQTGPVTIKRDLQQSELLKQLSHRGRMICARTKRILSASEKTFPNINASYLRT